MSVEDIGARDWVEIRAVPPRRWVLVDPSGRIEGLRSFRRSCSTAEEAHCKFTPRKRDRDKEIREGYTVRAEEAGDQAAYARVIHAAVDALTKEAQP